MVLPDYTKQIKELLDLKKPKQSLSPIDSPLKFEQKSNTVLNNSNVYDNLCNYSISDISYLDLDSSTD